MKEAQFFLCRLICVLYTLSNLKRQWALPFLSLTLSSLCSAGTKSVIAIEGLIEADPNYTTAKRTVLSYIHFSLSLSLLNM